jgi:hypothetical protein
MKSFSVLKFILFINTFCNLVLAQNYSKEDLLGKWDWYWSSGGFTGFCSSPEAAGYTKTLYLSDHSNLIDSDSLEFFLFKNDSLVNSGTFHLGFDDSLWLVPPAVIQFDSLEYSLAFGRLTNYNDLNFIAPCCDQCNHHFRRDTTFILNRIHRDFKIKSLVQIKSNLFIVSDLNEPFYLTISNLRGEIIFKRRKDRINNSINLSVINSNGIYFIVLQANKLQIKKCLLKVNQSFQLLN